MRVAISGSRTFRDRRLVEAVIDRLIDRQDYIVLGDAPSGVDRMAAEYVEHRADDVYDYCTYEADWKTYGRRAGHLRNTEMLWRADALIAIFADGPVTPGTMNAVLQARQKGIPTVVYHEGQWEGRLEDGSGLTVANALSLKVGEFRDRDDDD